MARGGVGGFGLARARQSDDRWCCWPGPAAADHYERPRHDLTFDRQPSFKWE